MPGANEFAWLGLCWCAKKCGNTSWLLPPPPGTRASPRELIIDPFAGSGTTGVLHEISPLWLRCSRVR